MIDSHFIKHKNLNFLNVSRETLDELDNYSKSIIRRNKSLNLISSSTENIINYRHILDSAQIIEFIDKKLINNCTDIGSGAGLPGIVLAILMKRQKPLFKVILYEKSFHKSNFLKDISKNYKLNTEVHRKDIFNQKNLETDIIISRAFKPLPTMLDIATKNFRKFKYIILFLGKSGKEILKDAKKTNPDIGLGEFITKELPPIELGRVAAQNAKGVIIQKVREADKSNQYEEYKDKVGEIAVGIVKRTEFGNLIIDLGKSEAIIKREELIPRETFKNGDRVRAYIYEVKNDVKGYQVFLSRTHPQFLSKLFFQEVPEIYEGVITVKSVARDPGSRAKISVFT